MVDFVLNQYKMYLKGYNELPIDALEKITQYATFLKQPLKLGFFIPCDENDVPLKEPKGWKAYIQKNGWKSVHPDALIRCRNYAKAKDSVLFEGFDFDPYLVCEMYFTIEDLINLNLPLTPNALKQFNETFTQK